MTPPSPSVDLDARRRPTEPRMASLPATRRAVRFHHWIRVLSPGPSSRTSSPAVQHVVVAGAAEEVVLRQRPVGLVQGDRVVAGLTEDLDQRHVGDGGVPPTTLTAPPFT